MSAEFLMSLLKRPQSPLEEEVERTPSPHDPIAFGGFPMDPQTSFGFDSANTQFAFDSLPMDSQSSPLDGKNLPRQRQKRRFYVNPANLSDPMGSFASFYSRYESGNDAEMVSFLGVTKKQFDHLMMIVGPRIQCKKSHQRPIPTEVRLAIFLRSRNAPHLSTNTIAKEFGVGYSTVSMIVKQVSRELSAPDDEHHRRSAKEEEAEVTENVANGNEPPKWSKDSNGAVQLRTWTEDEQDMLIFVAQQYPELCNRSNLRDPAKWTQLHQLFMAVADKINILSKEKVTITAIEAIVEWNRLWQLYDRERRAADLGVDSQWSHYDNFECLANGIPFDAEKPESSSPISDAEPTQQPEHLANGKAMEPEVRCSPKPADSQLAGIVDRLATAKRRPSPSAQPPTEKRSRADGAADPNLVIGKLEDYVATVVRKIVGESKRATEFDNYGQMVGSRLGRLAERDPDAVLEARREIDQILYRHEKAALHK